MSSEFVANETTPLSRPADSSNVSNGSSRMNGNNNNRNNNNNIEIDVRIPQNYDSTKMDTNSRIFFRVGIDLLVLLCVGLPILFFYLWGDPYKRGFFCDDESINHPFHDSTVRNWMLYIIGLVIPVFIIVTTEMVQAKRNKSSSSRHYKFFGYDISPWAVEVYKKIGVFGFGAAVSQLTTDIAKYTIGRLRPHFISVCQPVMPDGTDCSNPLNHGRYIEEFTCLGVNSTPRMLKEMRLSFPSGHSSFSTFTMVYIALYLHSRMTWRGSKLLKHFLQFLLIMIAWFTALSRISDYKHHWSDVLAGASIGAVCALIVANYVSDLFERKPEKPYLPTTRHELTSPVASPTNGNGHHA